MSILFIALVVVFLVSLVQAYNIGWQAGHDLHHDDTMPHHSRGKDKPKGGKGPYV